MMLGTSELAVVLSLRCLCLTSWKHLLKSSFSTCYRGIERHVELGLMLEPLANPEPGWLAELISWWIADDGFVDMSRERR